MAYPVTEVNVQILILCVTDMTFIILKMFFSLIYFFFFFCFQLSSTGIYSSHAFISCFLSQLFKLSVMYEKKNAGRISRAA